MDRNYPGTGFGDLGAGAGWSYERSAKASLVYGSSRSSHPDSELLHRQAYATPHPLQGYATNHHPGSSGQGGAWGAAGRSLGLSGLFDTGLHHASPSGPDASVMNLISALESRGPQPPPSASSLLSQFRTPSWQTAMHTPAPPELFISGALPGSGSFPSSSALSAYQHPASFSSRSFPATPLSLQDTPTFSPTSNGLLSSHDPLLHIKAPSQSSLGFDRLLSSQGAAAAAYRGSQDPTGATSAQASSARHLQSHQFNLLSSQLQDQSSQLYNASVFSSAQPQTQSQTQSNSAQERAVPRQDSVIKHYQRPSPAQSQLSSSAAHTLQHYLSCGGAGYQQIATHHRHTGLSCSPLGDQSPSSDHKPTTRTEQYRPIIQPPYSSSSSSSSSSAGKGTKSSSSSGYSSASSASSSRTPHTPPSASSTSSSSSSSSANSGAHPSNSIPTSSSSAAPSRQQPPPQSAPPPPTPQQQQPPPTSTSAAQSLPKSCLSGYGSPVPPVKTPTTALTGQTPPQQQQTQSYSPNHPPTTHLAQSFGGFSSPQAQDLSSGAGGKGYGSLGGRSQSYPTDIYGTDSAYGPLPSSLGGAGSPSLGYGAPGHSPALLRSSGSAGSGASGGSSNGTGNGNSGSGGATGSSMTNEGSGGGSYHIPDSSPSPSGNSGIIRPGLHSPVPACPTQSPGGAGSNKYMSSVLSPTFLASPQGYPDTRGPSSQPQSYHSTSSKTKTDTSMLGVGSQRSQDEVDDDEEFLIQHLLQAQASPAPQASHHHPQQQPQQGSQQTQPQPQSVPPTTDSGKGLSYDMSKTSEERYHPQSVIRTHSATATAGVANAGSGGTISGLDNQLEISLKKQQQHQQHHHQQQRNERSVGSSRSSGGRGSAEQVHSHLHHHDNLGSVVHYGRGDPYTQHSLAPQHASHSQHVSSHSQMPSHTQMELQKKSQERSDIAYPRKTPEIQQQHSQSQSAATLMDSPTDQSRQPQHLLQSVLSHTTRNKLEPHQQHHKMDSHQHQPQHHKMDSHQQHPQQHHKMESHRQHPQHHKMDSHQPHQQHPKMDSHPQHQQHHKMDSHPPPQQHSISQQQAVMESTSGRLGSSKHQAQSQSTQLQLQLQSQALEVAAAHYNHGPPPHQHEQSQVKPSSVVSSLDMLERSLSQTSSTDVAVAEERRGAGGNGGRSGSTSDRHRQQEQQQRQHPSHHQPQQTHHSQQHSASELHSFLSEPDIGLSTPSHMHHLSQHHPQQHSSSQHQQPHSHHPHSQPQPPHPHHIPPPPASAHSQPQSDPQQPLSSQLAAQQGQLDQQRSDQHQFDTVSPVEKADQNQQSNRFVPLTSICFPDSLLQDEDRSFFPGMEDMFCAEDYKSSCAGGAGPGQEEINDSHPGQEGMDSLKTGQSGGGAGGSGGPTYDIMGHHGGDQGYESYCHGLEEPTNNTMTLDLDSLKTHELPSTVNTEQLGLIQSQAPAMGMSANNTGPNNPGAKLPTGPGGTGTGTGSGGLQSPIFCSSRPKKLLKSSSFHLLKERRDPNTLPKKSYAQEYEFEDDEDKADQPADIRLNSRRLPDLLPDLVSSCRKGGGGSGSGSLSPLMGDIDFYHSSGYSSIGSHSLLPQDGPKKRGRKPTRPKREGPPRPRGRPRIRPMPEPYTPRGMMGEMGGANLGSVGGFSVEGRGRGRGRGSRGRGGRREDMFMEMSGKEQEQMHHHHLHQQQQLHHQPQQQHEPIPPLKIKLPIGSLSSSDSLLRTDSLSGTDPALSDGSVGSAPSLGLSPGPPCSTDSTRSQEKNKQKSQMMIEGVDEEGLEERGDEKDSESKAGFVASFLDFLKTGKRPPGLDISPGIEPDNGETSPCKSGGLRPLSPAPPPPPPPPPFGDSEGNGALALGTCPSPKRLEDELKRNLETLPSFSSDEEDSVGKNQDLQKSISSAISALYDTPQLASTLQPTLPPPPPQPQSTQGPLTPTMQPPTLSPQTTMHTSHTQPQSNEPDILQPEDGDMDEDKEEENEMERSMGGEEESDMTEDREPQLETLGAPKLEASLPEVPLASVSPEPPSVPPSPASSSTPSHSPLPPLSLPSPIPPPEEEQQENLQTESPVPPSSPSPPPPPIASLPQPSTPTPSSPLSSPPPPSSVQKESPVPSPETPASPEEPPAPKITSLHLAQKQEDAAIVGESEEDESESGGEGIFRERDEFVVRVEDIRTLKLALQTGREPPPIWRVQKALLQKFSPEIKDGQRQFCATSNYLGYFGDAKKRYQRIYVKFLENVNKKDYVRVCSRRPWRRAAPALRRQTIPRMASPPAAQMPARVVEKEERVAPPIQREQREKSRAATTTAAKEREKKEVPAALPKAKEKELEKEKRVQPHQEKPEKRTAERGKVKEEKKAVERKEKVERPPKSKVAKVKAEPPPKKRKKWLKEVPSSSESDSSDEATSENEMPVKGGMNNRAMREMFRSYVEMLVSTALDPDMIQALEDTDDELYLPPMRKIDSILSEQKRRLLRRVSMSSQHQEALHAYPQIIVDPLDSGVVRLRLSGDAYNRKTLNRVKKTLPKPQDLKLSSESYQIYSLYHSLHHYKYHTFLQCKKETNTIEQAAEDPGQEEVVQQCMANQSWLETLFGSFIELLTLGTKA
ncbi:proline-rich protein 12 isoform X2 [Thalassophryne amazonica]|uniref:proline-rich protein 12 isoform X2 n=1 Tax=Thalassophryne amazonica TaxID=390379 RepID=UPI001471B5D9|nr:proline-rich protein 12 isoform X2 [Thalassophryne amazonica]